MTLSNSVPTIVVAFNAAMEDAAIVALHSLFKNGNLQQPSQVVAFVDEDVNKERFKEFPITVREVDMEDKGYAPIRQQHDADFMRGASLALRAYDTLYDEGFDRVVWLDVDVMVLGSVDELLRFNLGETPIAACKDYQGDMLTVLRNDPDLVYKSGDLFGNIYFNTGIMAIDLQKFYTHPKIHEVGLVGLYNELGHNFAFMDQCLFNVLVDYPTVLPQKFNWFPDWNVGIKDNREEIQSKHISNQDVRVVHFVGHLKPWVKEEAVWWLREQQRIGTYVGLVEEIADKLTPSFVETVKTNGADYV